MRVVTAPRQSYVVVQFQLCLVPLDLMCGPLSFAVLCYKAMSRCWTILSGQGLKHDTFCDAIKPSTVTAPQILHDALDVVAAQTQS